MIKVERIKVYNIANAIYSARNALNSWDKSDSDLEKDIIGENDLALMRRLYKASLTGNHAHRKYLRQIFVSMDITAPLYLWKQIDQYRINVTTNSCSTMHRIHSKEFTIDDFSHEHLSDSGKNCLLYIIAELNSAREMYIHSKNKKHWWDMIQLLPSSYNQKRTLTMNYENAINIIIQRTGHRLTEWRDFVDVLHNLPYLDEIIKEEK